MSLNKEELRIYLKCAEELCELSVELVQAITKEREHKNKKITDEIKDVEKYLKKVKKINERTN